MGKGPLLWVLVIETKKETKRFLILLYQVQPHKNPSHLLVAKLQQCSERRCFTENNWPLPYWRRYLEIHNKIWPFSCSMFKWCVCEHTHNFLIKNEKFCRKIVLWSWKLGPPFSHFPNLLFCVFVNMGVNFVESRITLPVYIVTHNIY